MSFKGKVVLVTGGSSGIGAATAEHFSREGADVSIVARNENKLKNVERKCAKVGNKPLVIVADVSNDAERIINETINAFGKLDILVNNAGIARLGCILDGSILKIYDEIMNVNLRAVIQLTTLAAPHLIKTKGNIINVSSIAGCNTLGNPLMAVYCTSKAALNHFSRCAAKELAEHGVRVNVVSPGPVKTDIFDNSGIPVAVEDLSVTTALKRISGPDEIADLIAYLASDKARGITGSNFVTDNGVLVNKQIM